MTDIYFFPIEVNRGNQTVLVAGDIEHLESWRLVSGSTEGFTKKYRVHTLVYVEQHEEMPSTIKREKHMISLDSRGRGKDDFSPGPQRGGAAVISSREFPRTVFL